MVMKQYEELRLAVDIDVSPIDEKAVKQYFTKIIMLKVMAVVMVILYIILIAIHSSMVSVGRLFLCIVIFLYYLEKYKMGNRIKKILFFQCDAVHLLSFYTALVARSNRARGWGIHYYNIGSALFYSGRFADAKKVTELMRKYSRGSSDDFKMELLCCKLRYTEKNSNLLHIHCGALSRLAKQVRLTSIDKFFFYQCMAYPVLLERERIGEYQRIYDHYQSAVSYYKSTLMDVIKHYYQGQMAAKMNKQTLAEQHYDVVSTNGGTLWYKQDVDRKKDECQ